MKKEEKIIDEHVEKRSFEFSNSNTCDFDKLKKFLLLFDPYGYSSSMNDICLSKIDDIRNLITLCAFHHNNINKIEGNGTGIHNMSFPEWVSQCVCQDDKNPVPQENETLATVIARVTPK